MTGIWLTPGSVMLGQDLGWLGIWRGAPGMVITGSPGADKSISRRNSGWADDEWNRAHFAVWFHETHPEFDTSGLADDFVWGLYVHEFWVGYQAHVEVAGSLCSYFTDDGELVLKCAAGALAQADVFRPNTGTTRMLSVKGLSGGGACEH